MKNLILCDDCEVEKVSAVCRQFGYGIEIQAFHKPSLYEETPEIINDYKKYIDKIEFVSMHAPFADLNPGSSDPLLREVARKRFELAYEIATKLNISHIVFHIGYVPGTGIPKNWAGRCVNFWNEFLEGKSEKMNYYIENMLEKSPEILFDVIEGIDKHNVKVCLDIGHAHCNSTTSVADWIISLKDKIGYVHMHDNHGEKDEHLGFGQGNIPLVEVFNLLIEHAPKAIWTLECKTDSQLDSIEFLKKNNF